MSASFVTTDHSNRGISLPKISTRISPRGTPNGSPRRSPTVNRREISSGNYFFPENYLPSISPSVNRYFSGCSSSHTVHNRNNGNVSLFREQQGKCAKCGLQTHDINGPITSDVALDGRCLLCQPIDGDLLIQMSGDEIRNEFGPIGSTTSNEVRIDQPSSSLRLSSPMYPSTSITPKSSPPQSPHRSIPNLPPRPMLRSPMHIRPNVLPHHQCAQNSGLSRLENEQTNFRQNYDCADEQGRDFYLSEKRNHSSYLPTESSRISPPQSPHRSFPKLPLQSILRSPVRDRPNSSFIPHQSNQDMDRISPEKECPQSNRFHRDVLRQQEMNNMKPNFAFTKQRSHDSHFYKNSNVARYRPTIENKENSEFTTFNNDGIDSFQKNNENRHISCNDKDFIMDLSNEMRDLDHSVEEADNEISDILDIMKTQTDNANLQEDGCLRLKVLSRSLGRCNIIITYDGLKVILSSMKTHPKNPSLQANACGTLANLSFNSDACTRRAILFNLEGAERIIDAMKDHLFALPVQITACNAIGNLTTDTGNVFPSNNSYTSRLGSITDSISLCGTELGSRCNSEFSSQFSCLDDDASALTSKSNATVTSPSCLLKEASEFARKGAIPYIIRAMEVHLNDAKLLEQACGALMSLSSADGGTGAISRGIVSAGGIDALIQALKVHPYSVTVQLEGIGTLGNLAMDRNCEEEIGSKSGITFVFDAMKMHPTSSNIQKNCCNALRNLTSHHENLEILANLQPEPHLNAAGKIFPEDCKETAEVLLRKLQGNQSLWSALCLMISPEVPDG